MKKGAFIATIVLIIGLILEFMLFSNVFGGAPYTDLITAIQNSFWGAFIVIPYLGMILLLIFSIGSKKVLMIIGSVLGSLGLLAQIIGMLTSKPPENIGLYSTIYLLGTFVLVLGMLFYFIGCIQYRKQSMFGLFTGLFLFLVILIHNLIISFIIINSQELPQALGETLNLIGGLVQVFFFILHGFAYSFSKKKNGSWDDEEDTMSVESGDAFASYVPSGKPKKEKTKKAKKKKGSKDDDDFIFDF